MVNSQVNCFFGDTVYIHQNARVFSKRFNLVPNVKNTPLLEYQSIDQRAVVAHGAKTRLWLYLRRRKYSHFGKNLLARRRWSKSWCIRHSGRLAFGISGIRHCGRFGFRGVRHIRHSGSYPDGLEGGGPYVTTRHTDGTS